MFDISNLKINYDFITKTQFVVHLLNQFIMYDLKIVLKKFDYKTKHQQN
jgi:type 1 glutamine amidotransferase